MYFGPRVLFVRSGFSPPPGVGLGRVGGFFCRKNTAFLKSRVKNTCVLALWPLKGTLVESRFDAYLRYSRSLWHVLGKAWKAEFMHMYVILAFFLWLQIGLESRFDAY